MLDEAFRGTRLFSNRAFQGRRVAASFLLLWNVFIQFLGCVWARADGDRLRPAASAPDERGTLSAAVRRLMDGPDPADNLTCSDDSEGKEERPPSVSITAPETYVEILFGGVALA